MISEGSMKIVFFDVDGALNINGTNGDDDSPFPSFSRECLKNLSHVVYETGASLVISSSWRYIVLNGDMTTRGFAYMMRTHGLTSLAKVIGTTRADHEEDRGNDTRADQIRHWLRMYTEPLESFVILDDDWIGGFGDKFIQTNPSMGFTAEQAEEAIRILGKESKK
jgi:hypothetical protein